MAGLVPCADSGTRMRGRVSPRAAMAARMASRPHNSPCAPALGDIATAGMPVSVVSQFIRLGDQLQRALRGGLRRQGMQIAEARQPRHFLVQARIVLHGAGAQRIKPGVDGVVHPRQAHIMADHFRLAEARQADRAPCGAGRPAASSRNCHIGQIDAGGAMRPVRRSAFLHDPGRGRRRWSAMLVGNGFAGAGGAALVVHAHHSTSCSAVGERGEIVIGVGFGGGDDQQILARSCRAAAGARPARRRSRPWPPAHPPRRRPVWAA